MAGPPMAARVPARCDAQASRASVRSCPAPPPQEERGGDEAGGSRFGGQKACGGPLQGRLRPPLQTRGPAPSLRSGQALSEANGTLAVLSERPALLQDKRPRPG